MARNPKGDHAMDSRRPRHDRTALHDMVSARDGEIRKLRAENERLTVERDELKAALSRVAEQREEYLSQRDAAISENESLRREVLGDE